ncbi:hypothetical protein [Tissierella pigra]|uniref:Homeodomain phBC6A51-type domain-containing protein n=1 Tax=Tissierella pigra TaxID=2607614 RepID=A0A6N7XVB8_9FIRM|nr:hypothetical protein [Tissierella pigra]MSU01393.1 hypothetical protein [Tissierella pigra]
MINLSDKERKAIELVLEGRLNRSEIAEECGYANRSSIYKILQKEEAKEYMQQIAERSVSEAVAILKANANEAARNLVKIASGDIKAEDKQTVYALLQAINSVLEKSGLSSKNITLNDLREKEANVSDEDILTAIDEAREEDLDNVIDIRKAK